MRLCRIALLLLYAGFAGSLTAAETWSIPSNEAVFAVVTQRGGIAARLAHDHLITADSFTASLDTGPDGISGFTFESESAALVVDDPQKRDQLENRLIELGLLNSSFGALSESNREKIREHMLAGDQLGADEFPSIQSKVVSISEKEHEFMGYRYTHRVEIECTVRGVTVNRAVSANIEMNDDHFDVEAVGAFRFTEFDIKPYSGMLGAVKNKDEFYLYCSFQARSTP